MTAEHPLPLAQTCHDLLRAQGFASAHFDDQGSLVFEVGGLPHVLHFDLLDPGFLRLSIPNFWSVDEEEERVRAVAVANSSNQTCKLSKLVLGEGITSLYVDVLLPDGVQVDGPYLRRLLSIAKSGVRSFALGMHDTITERLRSSEGEEGEHEEEGEP